MWEIAFFVVYCDFYGKRFKKGFPKWRWHYSSSRGISQIQFWRIQVPKTLIFMIFWTFDLSPTLGILYFWLRLCRSISKIQENTSYLKHIVFGIRIISKIVNLEKVVCLIILGIRFITSWRSWICDRYLTKNMKWTSWNFEVN